MGHVDCIYAYMVCVPERTAVENIIFRHSIPNKQFLRFHSSNGLGNCRKSCDWMILPDLLCSKLIHGALTSAR
ncbi:hypothetical protein MRB53_016912 [Persea americana]|uniref:Uncharacterized protein n=1 Tax=Persea americana TaxID=3435 RepID=A0ACC2M469_PERAE|nr:hypothetical protein MRB53_016912 [Persea americana]